MLTKRSEQL
jgi:hypothetical protein